MNLQIEQIKKRKSWISVRTHTRGPRGLCWSFCKVLLLWLG